MHKLLATTITHKCVTNSIQGERSATCSLRGRRTPVYIVGAFSDKVDRTKGKLLSSQAFSNLENRFGYGKEEVDRSERAVSESYPGTALLSKEVTHALYSVDQIREGESPWKAMTEIARIDRRAKKASPFKRRLQERKKIRMLYGNLAKKALDRYLKESDRPEDLLLVLESRLEIVLKRSALFPTVQSARQAILQGGISVNGTVVRSSRYHCTPGDYIQIVQRRAPQTLCFLESRSMVMAEQRGCKNSVFAKNKSSYRERLANPAKLGYTPDGKLQDLFVFSELLQLFDRKTGRLHTSTCKLFDQDSQVINSTFYARNRLNSEKSFLRKTFHGLVNASRESKIVERNRARTNQKLSREDGKLCIPELHESTIQKNTPSTSKAIATEQGHATCKSNLAKLGFYPGIGKDKVEKVYTQATQLAVGERAESERPLWRAVASRPVNLEVSYRNLCVVFLYPPQRICVDISIDLSLLL